MSPRTGRPKVENPQNNGVKTWLDKETNKKLKEFCKKNNVSIAEALRMALNLLLES